MIQSPSSGPPILRRSSPQSNAGTKLVPDVQRDRLVAAADREGGLLEGRLRHHRADAVRQRIALCRQAEDICVEVVVGVLVVEGADRISAGRQIVEHDGHRRGARLDPSLCIGLVALEELGRARIQPDKDIALGVLEAVDRDDNAGGRGRAGNKDQGGGESEREQAKAHAGIDSCNAGFLNKGAVAAAARPRWRSLFKRCEQIPRCLWSAAFCRMHPVVGRSLSRTRQYFESWAKEYF